MSKRYKRRKHKKARIEDLIFVFAIIAACLMFSKIQNHIGAKAHIPVITFPSELWLYVVMAIAGVLAVYFLGKFVIGRNWLKKDFSVVSQMDGHNFEKYLEAVFASQGYLVKNVGKHGKDYGGDLVLTKGTKKTLVQAKRYSGSVGVAAVQEAIAAREFYGCSDAMVVTSSYFTSGAKEMAEKCGVTLRDRDWLLSVTKKYRKMLP